MIPLTNHLWQSTLAAAAIALLALALQRNRAPVRHWLWLAASLKFLVPFALLVTLGNQFAWRAATVSIASPASMVLDAMSQSFSPVESGPEMFSPALAASRLGEIVRLLVLVVWAAGCAAMLLIWWRRWRRVAVLVRDSEPLGAGREWEILHRLEMAAAAAKVRIPAIALAASGGSIEPGVFGIRRPVLLWPRSISVRLTDDQIAAIFAHELAHVRRRDNLWAALHMIVQSLFWFHPLVWWIGARLVDERERACDEEVIEQGSAPQIYAEGILKTCKFCVESPLACLSGVTGSDLTARIEQIMKGEGGLALAGWRRRLLATAAVVAVAGPIGVGMLHAPSLRAQSPAHADGGPIFDSVSIKPSGAASRLIGSRFLSDGRYVATNMTLRTLIANAYGGPLQPLLGAQLVGGPAWIDNDRFDILAQAAGGVLPGLDTRGAAMIRKLLADRFQLVVHNEQRQLPIYELMVSTDGTLGTQIRTAATDCNVNRDAAAPPPPPPPPPLPGDRPFCGIRFLRGSLSAGGMTMGQIAGALSRLAGRPVVDRTDLEGRFDFDLQWTPDRPAPGLTSPPGFLERTAGGGGPILAAVRDQLGLQLVAEDRAVDVLVVDRAERPTINWLFPRSSSGAGSGGDFESFALAVPPPPPPPPPAAR